MQSNLEILNGLERRVNLAVQIATIDQEVEKRLRQLAKNVKIAGFRPGKVPMSQVAKMHGAGVRQEVLGESLQQRFYEAMGEHQLRVAGMPRFEPQQAPEQVGEIGFSAVFEVYPQVSIGDLSSVSMNRPVVAIEDANVDSTLETLRKQRVQYVKVERASQNEDLVKFDFNGTLNGEPFEGGAAKDFSTVIGAGRMLKDFEDNLVGMMPGEARGFDMTFPENYPAANLAGQNAHFDIVMKEISEPKLPEVDAQFAEALGVAGGDVEQLRQEVKANLEREIGRRVKARVKETVMEILLDNVQIEIPNSLVEMEISRLKQQMISEMQARGGKALDESQISSDMFKAQAERRVKLGLIIAEVVSANNLAPQAGQIRALVDEFAQGYEDPQEVVQWYYEKPERLQEVEALALEDNVVAWIMGQVQVADVPTKFEELMGRTA